MSFTVRNHYVPQWYQHRFFGPDSGQSRLYYLDLKPDLIKLPGGCNKPRTALRRLGPLNCFKQEHLYTLVFGNRATDVIEKAFFGQIDQMGNAALTFFENYSVREGAGEAYQRLLAYVAAQLFRTPKGLQLLQRLARTKDHQATLIAMENTWQLYGTIWSEGVLDVLQCKESPTKFIITDSPVTTYNRQVFPGAADMKTYGMAMVERIGTRTLFPLGREHCLVVTNLQYVRNPKISPLKMRENPRYYAQDGLIDLRKVQRGRELNEQEVLAINYVLKTNALRYIAAPNKEWLYPEDRLQERFWSKLGGKYFLCPDPRRVSFTTGIVAGGPGGRMAGTNEYGHWELDDPRAQKLRDVEWKTFQAAKQAWNEWDRLAGREPPKRSFDDL